MQPLLSSADPPVGTEPMSLNLISWLGSINFCGAIIGTLFWGTSSDRLGRKCTAMIIACPFIISWSLKFAAQNAWWLIVARIINGIGCSGVIINTPIYVAEMAEDKIRGSLGSFLMIFLNAGCVFSYVIGSVTSYHTLALICLCIPVLFLAAISCLPESPVYLWTRGRRDTAEISLLWFRGGNNIQTVKELESLNLRSSTSSESPSFSSLFQSVGIRKALLISITFVLGQQLSGMLSILTYTVSIFRQSGSSLSPNNSMIVVGVLQFLSAIMSSALVDRVGRRVLLISSYVAMTLSLSTLGGYLYFEQQNWYPLLRWIPIICISITVVFYSIGVGPVPFVVMSEIFPPNIRGFVTSKIQLLSTSLSFAMVKAFPFMTDLFGHHGCFLLYASSCGVLSIVTYFLVPETKGKSLQTILNILNGANGSNDAESSELVAVHNTNIVKTSKNNSL